MWTLSIALDGSQGEEAWRLCARTQAFVDKADAVEALHVLSTK